MVAPRTNYFTGATRLLLTSKPEAVHFLIKRTAIAFLLMFHHSKMYSRGGPHERPLLRGDKGSVTPFKSRVQNCATGATPLLLP